MKSIKNLTRFTYETAAFQGWRLSLSRSGTVFRKYYSDKKFGDDKKSLAAAEAALAGLKVLLDASKLVDGKHTPATIRKAEKLLEQA
ncbi:MAG: hypothetical protein NTW21_15330 [Verrucomicrobia bacterium]|nr:hypothetical protein [Verrucomicrobiota bacterium]